MAVRSGVSLVSGDGRWLHPCFATSRASPAANFRANGSLVEYRNAALPWAWDAASGTPLVLAIEEARQNYVTNPRMEGATNGVIGSGGVAPTSLSISVNGTSCEIANAGTTQNGVPVVDLRWFGTPNATTTLAASFMSNTAIVAASGETWSARCHVARVGGSLTNITSPRLLLMGRTADGASLTEAVTVGFTDTSALTPISGTQTLAQGTTARFNARFDFAVTNGQAVDVTYRLGATQIEKAAFVSSPVLPTAGTPASATRSATTITAPATALPGYNAAEGTMVVRARLAGVSGFQIPWALDDGTANNRIMVDSNAGAIRFTIVTGGATQHQLALGSVTAGADFTVAASWSAAGAAASLNGAAAATGGALTVPTTPTLRLGHRGSTPTAYVNGTIRRLVYLPRRVTNAEVVQLAAG